MKLLAPLEQRIIVFIVSLALFMDALDTTIINTAIPAMAKSLQVNPVNLKIALISYLITLAIFIPISGYLADRFGIKRIFIFAVSIFTISSIWCGFARSLTTLVCARSLQGLGGALMLPVGRLIILRTFPRHQFVSAMNAVVMVVSLGLMLGPLAGGAITEHLSWQWIFWVNIPIGLVTVLLIYGFMPATTRTAVGTFDTLGFILFGGGLAIFIFALSIITEQSIDHETIYLLFILAALFLGGYVKHSKHKHHPIIKTQLLKIRTLQISLLGNLFARLGFGGIPFLLPLMLQISLGYSPQVSGLLMVPLALGVVLVKSLSLRILKFFGYKNLLVLNTICVALALWLFCIVNVDTSASLIALIIFIFGFLISLQFSGMNSLAYADIAADDLSAATSILSTMQQLAQSLGVAIGALLLQYYASNKSPQALLTISGFHHTFIALGIITLLSATIFLRLHRSDGQQMLTQPKQQNIVLQK